MQEKQIKGCSLESHHIYMVRTAIKESNYRKSTGEITAENAPKEIGKSLC